MGTSRKCLLLAALGLLGVVLLLSPVAAQQPPGSGTPGPGTPAGAPPKAGSLMAEDVYTPLVKGYDFMRAGNYEAANHEFETALSRDRYNPFALNNLAAIRAQQGKLKDAMAFLVDAQTYANNYLDQVQEVCFTEGLCTGVKPVKKLGTESAIAKIIQDNMVKLKAKIAAAPPGKPEPSTPPPMK